MLLSWGMETQVSRISLKKSLLVRTVFPKLFVQAKCTYFLSDKQTAWKLWKGSWQFKGRSSCHSPNALPILSIPSSSHLLLLCVFLDPSVKKLKDVLPNSITHICDCRVTLNIGPTDAESSERILEDEQAFECQKWKTIAHNVETSYIPWTLILSGLVKVYSN